MCAQKLEDKLGSQIRHQAEIKPGHRSTRKHCFYSCLCVSRLNATDRAGRTEYVFLHQGRPFHRTEPPTDTKLALQPGFIKFYRLERFRILGTNGRDP